MAGIPKGYFTPLIEALGDVLEVTGYETPGAEGQIIRRHVMELDSLPKELLKKLRREGLRKIILAPGCVPDFPGFELLDNVPVPGFRGATWNERAGAYAGNTRTIVLGTFPPPPVGMVIHEMAHTLGDILGYYDDFRVRVAYKRTLGRLNTVLPYAKAGGIRLPKEFFANSVTYAIIHADDAEVAFGIDYIRFIREIVMKGRTARTK